MKTFCLLIVVLFSPLDCYSHVDESILVALGQKIREATPEPLRLTCHINPLSIAAQIELVEHTEDAILLSSEERKKIRLYYHHLISYILSAMELSLPRNLDLLYWQESKKNMLAHIDPKRPRIHSITLVKFLLYIAQIDLLQIISRNEIQGLINSFITQAHQEQLLSEEQSKQIASSFELYLRQYVEPILSGATLARGVRNITLGTLAAGAIFGIYQLSIECLNTIQAFGDILRLCARPELEQNLHDIITSIRVTAEDFNTTFSDRIFLLFLRIKNSLGNGELAAQTQRLIATITRRMRTPYWVTDAGINEEIAAAAANAQVQNNAE